MVVLCNISRFNCGIFWLWNYLRKILQLTMGNNLLQEIMLQEILIA
jgi:hypothetical protein